MTLPATIPNSTYRVQLHAGFTFDDTLRIVDYLDRLGISHLYTSPFLRARSGSTHGYDIIDHNQFNPEIGTAAEFEGLVDALHAREMGIVLDFVPNHMGIGGSENQWWNDVLEWGESSPFARCFDIDWEPMRAQLRGKVLLPVLGDHYADVLRAGELQLRLDDDGTFAAWYFHHRFPINPRYAAEILERSENAVLGALGREFGTLPARPRGERARAAARTRAAELKERLKHLVREPQLRAALDSSLAHYNGTPGDEASFASLQALLAHQAYRPAQWRVAFDEINYRRFFDINELAGLRMEDAECFALTHRLVFDLLARGRIQGLRIDHIDGLFDPGGYCRLLRDRSQALGQSLYLIVEKITAFHEETRQDWNVDGTTGYDFMNLVNGLFVDRSSERRMDRIYARFVGRNVDFEEVLHVSKHRIIRRELAAELAVLATALDRIAHADVRSSDFTLNGLREMLTEVVAAFPVYRTYVTGGELAEQDRRDIEWAVALARKRAALADPSVFEFIEGVLTTDAVRSAARYPRRPVLRFAMKFQQYTSPVTAKSLEDTAFYRYHRLVSLNEVGGDPRRFGTSVAAFHRTNEHRARRWPRAMLATATHDTKRGEDTRARINVLSEIPAAWREALVRWKRYNRRKLREADGRVAPQPGDEYLLYQTLVGSWPFQLLDPEALDPAALRAYAERIDAYMRKALREGKERSSWSSPNAAYEEAVSAFVHRLLDGSVPSLFLPDMARFAGGIARAGAYNSLAQIVLKCTCPGVPDTYQGTELWDLSLVDPDNRRPVDYALRAGILDEFEARSSAAADLAAELTARWRDGRLKMYVLWRLLRYRRANGREEARYEPLDVAGERATHVCAFALDDAVVVVPRLVASLLNGESEPAHFGKTFLSLPERFRGQNLRNIFTGALTRAEGQGRLSADAAFDEFPVAVLALEETRR